MGGFLLQIDQKTPMPISTRMGMPEQLLFPPAHLFHGKRRASAAEVPDQRRSQAPPVTATVDGIVKSFRTL